MMKFKIILLNLTFILITICSYSQVTDIIWQKCFATVDNDSDIYCISEFNNGYLVGIQVSEESEGVSNYHGGADAWFVHFDTLGNILWERCYGGSLGDGPIKIVPIDSNYYYLILGTMSFDGDVQGNPSNPGEGCIWVVKIDTGGNILWQSHYGGRGHRITPTEAILTPDGGLLFLSRIFGKGDDVSTYYGSNDVWIHKIDTTGVIQWETTIGTPGMDNGWKVILTNQNTYLALCGVNANGGMSECEITGPEYWDLDLWLVEIDMDGNIIGQDCFGGTDWDNSYDLVESEDGYAIVTSYESNDGDVTGNHGDRDIWLLKIDKEKQIMWQKCLGGFANETPHHISNSEDGGYIIIGATDSNDGDVVGIHHQPGYDRKDIWIVKTNRIGELEWQHCFGGLGNEWFPYLHCVLKKNDYNYVLAPITEGNSGDVDCDGDQTRGWIFEIKDCQHFAPAQPQQPTGKDTLCVNTDSITTYNIAHANNAWYYEWQLQPEEAGILSQDSLTTTIHWNTTYEGPATLKVRSSNDCGESAWSDSLVIQTYMCLGTEENSITNNLRVYPNPASSTLIVEIENFNTFQKSKIEIYNSLGYRVYGYEVADNVTTVDICGWNKGIYVVRVLVGDGTVGYRKIVVN